MADDKNTDKKLDDASAISSETSDLEQAWVAAGDAAQRPTDAPGVGEPDDESDAQRPTDAPGDSDDVDPELLKLPRPRRRRHPAISLSVMLLSLGLMAYLWADFRYFFAADTPRDLGRVEQALKDKRAPLNSFVTIHGAPDRKHALLLEGRVSGYESFFRLRQGDSRFFVQRHRSKRVADRNVPTVHSGRLVRFDSLSYHDAVSDYFHKSVTVAHELSFARFAKSKSDADSEPGGKQRLTDNAGRAFAVEANTLFWVNVTFPREWLIQFSKSAYGRREAAAKQLDALKLPVAPDDEPSPSFFRFVVLADDEQSKKLISVFSDKELHAGVVKRQVSYAVRWADLAVADGQLEIRAKDPTFPSRFVLGANGKLQATKTTPVRVPPAAVRYISSGTPLTIPADALVVLAGQEPGAYWLYPLIYLLLVGFIALNGVSMYFRMRAEDR